MALSPPSAGCSRTLQRSSSGQQQHAVALPAAVAAFALLLATATGHCCCMALQAVARRSWCMHWPGTWGPTCSTSLQVGGKARLFLLSLHALRLPTTRPVACVCTRVQADPSFGTIGTVALHGSQPCCPCQLTIINHTPINNCAAGDLLKSCQDQGQRLLRAIMRVRARRQA
jgi:hypothetical protein